MPRSTALKTQQWSRNHKSIILVYYYDFGIVVLKFSPSSTSHNLRGYRESLSIPYDSSRLQIGFHRQNRTNAPERVQPMVSSYYSALEFVLWRVKNATSSLPSACSSLSTIQQNQNLKNECTNATASPPLQFPIRSKLIQRTKTPWSTAPIAFENHGRSLEGSR